jgi:hypothetical protein
MIHNSVKMVIAAAFVGHAQSVTFLGQLLALNNRCVVPAAFAKQH